MVVLEGGAISYVRGTPVSVPGKTFEKRGACTLSCGVVLVWRGVANALSAATGVLATLVERDRVLY